MVYSQDTGEIERHKRALSFNFPFAKSNEQILVKLIIKK